MRIVKITGTNRGTLRPYLRKDVIKHAFAIFDLDFAFESSVFYVVTSKDQVTGYLLIY